LSDSDSGRGPHDPANPKPALASGRLHLPNRRITATRTGETGAAAAAVPHFSQPVRQILMMLTVLALVLVGGWITYGRILPIFMANQWLNGLILAVFALGVLACFWQVAQLVGSVSWIERFAARRRNAVEKGVAARGAQDGDAPPRLLAPLAALLGTRGPVGGVISTGSARSILDSVATRIEEIRDITKYLSNLLIFLGLLGTFYGLATTVPAVVDTIRALAPQEGETGLQVFEKLMGGLEAQLGGMATAFSSSLLGLAGSLVVGLLELFVTHGQNRFYRELEEWMSGFTRIGLAGSESDAMDQAAFSGFLEQMGAQLDRLHHYHAERDASRDEAAAMADERIIVMAEALEALISRGESEREATEARVASLSSALTRIAEGQEKLLDVTRDAFDKGAENPADRAAPTPPDLSGIERALMRMGDDLTDGREQMLNDLRADILVLTRAVRAARFGDPFRDDQLREPPLERGKA
jgi:hypothetical protein